MPPASAAQGIIPNLDQGGGLSLLLGTDYERRKQRLQQELHLDYKQYLEKKKDLKTAEPNLQPQGLSLLIDERTSVKEKLKEERNKEYNLFLQERAQTKGLKRGAPLVTSKVQASDGVCRSSPYYPPPTSTNVHFAHRERPASRRDAATLTEAVDNGKSPGNGDPRHQRRSRWNLPRPKEIYYSSEEEFNTDKEEELSHSMSQNGHTQKPDYKEEKITREHGAKRGSMDERDVEASGVHDQNINNWVWKSKGLQMQDGMKTAARSRPPTSKDGAVFATGLMIGATEEQEAAQMRKEHYKQELLKQIAEHEKNKRKEKELELNVAATGITDPEKQPDRIKQFGAVHQTYQKWRRDVPYKPETDDEAKGKDPHPKPDTFPEGTGQRGPPRPSPSLDLKTSLKHMTGKTGPETGAAPRVLPLDHFDEDYNRDVSNMLGEVTVQRVAGAHPPVPPTLPNTYKTPYDAAYYYYGTRNPLDPNLPYNQNDLPGGMQQSENFQNHLQRRPPLKPSGHTDSTATDQHGASLLAVGELSGDKAKQKRDSALRYQEELRQQIKEIEERKRKEKEEKELLDAKIEAEMIAYSPWGRSGGGAPIKDQRGNLISDLNHMHRINEESYRNPMSRDHSQRQNFVIRNGHTTEVEARAPLPSQRKPGFTKSDQQQPQGQDNYKEDLRQQIEENRRKQVEERERNRIEEEKEEKRLAEQRARILQEYEEEQRKQKKIEHRPDLQAWVHKHNKHHRQDERKVKREEDNRTRFPEGNMENESPKVDKAKVELQEKRGPSPPIPTLQKKQTNTVASKPTSAVSHVSSRTERSVSAPHIRPVPMPELQDGQQEVIRELSTLRRYLRKEQRQLEVKLAQTDQQETHYTPPNRHKRQAKVEAVELLQKEAVQPPTRRFNSAHADMKNIREFNQLKYRDTVSREEVRHMYPDPPTDAQSLDIQQQALLREQQRRIQLLRRKEEHDILDQQQGLPLPRNNAWRYAHRDSILPSETAFIGVYSGDAGEDFIDQQRSHQPLAEPRERTAQRRRHIYDEVPVSVDQIERDIQPDTKSLQPHTNLNLEAEVRHRQRRDSGTADHRRTSEGQCDDEVDVLSLRSTPSALERRVSVETVATEPWLRPGTSNAVKHSGDRLRPGRTDAPPWLTHRIT
ncbi:centrosome and spindle pole-associated protein 1 [Sphaeramia orbicularis]|uniref:centrosome and spindle pole-associated protein 1 n=1 Tax=Sphaeramia orbicularis TaxID=375764 RepID=UPI00117C9C72|nr:centrosome and spindle pole-associated protein 1 [Sphaeramia orbicularis]